MVKLGILYASEETGKVGYRSRYSHRYSEAEQKRFLADNIKPKLEYLQTLTLQLCVSSLSYNSF